MIDLSSSCDALTKAPTTCALSFPAKIPLGPPPSSRLDEFPLDDTAGSRGERRKGKAYGLLPQCRFVIRDNVTNVTSSLPSLPSPEIEMLLAHSAFEIGSRRGLRLFSTSFQGCSCYGDKCFCHSSPVSVGCYPQSPDDRESDYVSEAFLAPFLAL